MDLTCYEFEPGRVELRPASHRREWMDKTPQGFAYRCIPLGVANSHGWELLSPVSFAATWNGGDAPKDISLKFTDASEKVPENFIETHFGCGVLTFNPLMIFRTEPGYNLWVSGSPNEIKDGIQPLSAMVETDWMPFTFSMNWRFTSKKQWVRFAKGEPFGFVFPIKRGDVDACAPKLKKVSDEPKLNAQYVMGRMKRNAKAMMGATDGEQFLGWYAKGVNPDGSGAEVSEHQVRCRPLPFERG